MATHNNTLQGLLTANAGGTVPLVAGDTYIEDSQIIVPANTVLEGEGILKGDPSFYQNVYNGQYDLHKFLLKQLAGSTCKDFTINGDNKNLWGGSVVEGDNCNVVDVDVIGTWFSGVWFELCTGSSILRGTMTDAANVPGNWATGMVEMRDVVNIMIDGVNFVDTMSIGCGGVKAKAFSETNVRHLEDVTIQNCDFDLFKWHGWLNEGDSVIGNYAIELSKNRIKNLQILDNTMNTTISVAGDYDHAVDYNYGKLIVKRNHIYPEHQSSNILETSQSGVVFEDNYVEGGGYVISNFLNWTTQGIIDPYFNLRFNNNVFYFPNTRPTALFRFAREYNNVEFLNNTIYGPTGIREILNFADATCDGTNIDFNQNTVTCFGTDTLLKYGGNYSLLDTTDNKWHGNFNGVTENVGSIPFKNSGTKPFPFFETLITGYGAVDPNASASAPDAPSALQVTSVTNDSISLAWTDNSDNETGFELEHSPNGTDTWTTININDNTETYSHGGLSQGQTLHYRIRAINSVGNSAYSNIAFDTTSTGTVDQFVEIFNSLSYDPSWTADGLGIQELSGNQSVEGSNSLRLYLEAVKGVYDADNSRAQIEYSPSVLPLKYPPNLSATGQKFAVFIPSSDEVNDQFTTLIYAQRQADSPEFTSSAPFSIYLQDGYFRITHRTEDTGNKGNITEVDDVQVLPLVSGHWFFFVINTYWDYSIGGNGFHQVFVRQDLPPTQSDLKINYTGPTGYNDTANTQDTVKTWFTNYKWDWGVDANVDLSTGAGITGSELFFDDILIQNDVIDVPLGSGQVPIIPSNLRIASKTTSQLTIAWNDNSSDEDNFVLSHSPNGVDTWIEVFIQSNTESYPHSGLSEGQKVYYKIKAININGESADTSVINGTTETTTANVFTDAFELVSTNPPWRDDVGQNPPTRDATHKLSGTYSQRFYIPVATNYTNTRAQKQFQGDVVSGVTWYVPYPLPTEGYTRGFSVAIYVPSDFQPDLWNEILLQHKNSPDPGLSGLDNNPSWSLGIKGKNYSTGSGMEIFCTIRYVSVNPTNDPNDKVTIENDNIATVVPGQWHYFVVNTHWNYRTGSNGYHKVYMKVGSPPTIDDVILDYNGPTGYNAQYFGSLYLNIYKWPWNDAANAQASIDAWNALGVPANLQKREVWMDDFRMQESAIAVPPGGSAPNAPSLLVLGAITRTSITVSWQDNSSDETGFTISHSPDNINWTDIILNANTTSFLHTGLSEEQTVYYKVRADNATGPSAYSNTESGTTLPSPNTGWNYRIVGGNRRGALPVQGISVFN